MAGSAVVTINRSRLNMNTAAEVSANVQPVLARALRALRSGGRGAASTRLPSARRTRTSLGRAPGSRAGGTARPAPGGARGALGGGGGGAATPRPPPPRRTRTSLGRAPGSNPGDEWAQLTCRGRRELPAAADIELPVDVAEVPLD